MTPEPPQTTEPFGPEPVTTSPVPILDPDQCPHCQSVSLGEPFEIEGVGLVRDCSNCGKASPANPQAVEIEPPQVHDDPAVHAEVHSRETFRQAQAEPDPEPERVPTWAEVQSKIMDRVPLTAVERQVAESAQVFLPADYPTTAAPVEVARIAPEAGPSMFDQLAELPIEERIARLERLQAEEAQTFRNVVAELGRANGREAQLMEIIDGGTPELAVPQL